MVARFVVAMLDQKLAEMCKSFKRCIILDKGVDVVGVRHPCLSSLRGRGGWPPRRWPFINGRARDHPRMESFANQRCWRLMESGVFGREGETPCCRVFSPGWPQRIPSILDIQKP
ncbi:MAG: hypothetical protein ACK56I_32510, partial [bacterium]